MLSLGTGEHTRAYTYEQTRWWGQLEWARPALDMVFDGVADTIEFEAGDADGRPLRAPADARWTSRPTTSTTRASATSRRCAREAEQLIAASEAELDRVCAILAA